MQVPLTTLHTELNDYLALLKAKVTHACISMYATRSMRWRLANG